MIIQCFLLVTAFNAAYATICLDVCTCLVAKYTAINRSLDTVDCTAISESARKRAALNETYGGNLAVLLKRNELETTLDVEGLSNLHNLIYLDLSENKLKKFSNVVVEGKSLRALYLDGNGLDYIPALDDYGYVTLDILSLSHNVIESFHSFALRSIETLKSLNLSYNRLSELEVTWLAGLIELQRLDLSNNIISTIPVGCFHSLISLHYVNLQGNVLHAVDSALFVKSPNVETLLLDWNHLKSVPSESLRSFRKIQLINLSGNHFTRFLPGTFAKVNVTHLKLNELSQLKIVDDGAFSDLPNLRTLEIHDNHQLAFLGPHSVVRAPKLKTFHCQNNRLRAFPKTLIDQLPNFHVLGIYGNPLLCDCSIHWILENIYVERKVTLLQVENTLCSSPLTLLHEAVYKLDINPQPVECPPTIVDLIPSEITVFEADSISADCRAYGQPTANISWLTANNESLLSNSHHGNVAVTTSGTLLVAKATKKDNGLFTCLATNSRGYANKTMRVIVKSMEASIVVIQVRAHSVLITWNGTIRTEQYRITCRRFNTTTSPTPSSSSSPTTAPFPGAKLETETEVDLQQYWRTYTLNNLRAGTDYQFCLSMLHQGHSHRERCTYVRTLDKLAEPDGIFDVKPYFMTALSIGGSLSFAIIIAILLIYRKHYLNKKRLKEMYGDNMSQLFLSRSMSTFSDVTVSPVTYENAAASNFDDVTDDEALDLREVASSQCEHLIANT